MNWVLDIVLLGIILFSAIRHFSKGLMSIFYNIGKFIVSILAAVLLGKPVGALISNGFMSAKVNGFVYEKLCGFVGDSQSLADFFADIPAGFRTLVSTFGVDLEGLCETYSNAENTETVLRDMASTIGSPIANMISAIIAYISIFLVVFIVLTIVLFFVKKIEIPVFKTLDKVLGLVLGLALGIFSASLIATTAYSILEFVSAMNTDSTVMNVYSGSYVFKFIYDLKIFEFIRNLIM